MGETMIEDIVKVVPYIKKMHKKKVWLDYDEKVDVLYVNFTYPSTGVEHEEDENGIIRNYDSKGNLVGMTIMAAKRFIR